jgi:subtilase family serine protease
VWHRIGIVLAAVMLSLSVSGTLKIVAAQDNRASVNQRVGVPKSSEELPADAGLRAHTHLLVLGPGFAKAAGKASPGQVGPPFSGYAYETPASFACLYQLVSREGQACNPNVVTQNPTGGSRVIAIVDAYDDPNAASDLANFSAQFGLPPADFSVKYEGGVPPTLDPTGGWELEESLDIEWAHAMAPNARIILVEANSNSFSDLLTSELIAGHLVSEAGGGEVSNSWGGSEFASETSLDFVFTVPGVVYLASTGDGPGTEYPSVSPNVVGVGGTSTNRNPYTGDLLYEGAWSLTGGGPSPYEPRPSYQNIIESLAGPSRVVPDVSLDANPITGVWVLDTNLYEGQPGGWFIVGGTSVSVQATTGIINAAGRFHKSSAAELSVMYQNLFNADAFRDITRDNCGPYGGFLAVRGYDFCTGLGSNAGYEGK